MDDSQLRIVETLACVKCGTPSQIAQAEDLLRYTCPQDGTRHVLTVRAASEVPVDPSAPDPLIGRTMGPSRIICRAGSEGGLPIYHGLDVALNQPLAVRVLMGPGARDREQLQAFVRAGRLAAAVRHAALATVSHLGRLEDGLFAVGPPLEGGEPFDRAVGGARRLGRQDALRFGRLLAEALALLHDQKIVHRNIGPKTVYLRPDGAPQLRNFAFAFGPDAPPERGIVVGQPGYLAPEQATGEAVDARADLYALGALLYHALAGRPPFSAATAADSIRAQLGGTPPDHGPLINNAPAEVTDLILSLLSREPAERPADARTVLGILTAAEGAAAARPARQAPAAIEESSIALIDSPAAAPAPEAGTPGEDETLPVKPAPPGAAGRAREEVAERPRAASASALEFGPRPTPEPGPATPAEAPAMGPAPAPESPGGLGELILDSEREAAARAGGADAAGLADVAVPVRKPIWKRNPRLVKLGALGGVALIVALVAWQLLKPASPAPQPPPTGVAGKPKDDGKTKGEPKAVSAAAKAEEEAKAALPKLEADAKTNAEKPELTLRACDEFLAKYGTTSSAAAARKMREDAVAAQAALREKEAAAKLPALEALLNDASKSYTERLDAADALLKQYAETKTAEEMRKRRDGFAKANEEAAEAALGQKKGEIEPAVTAKQYGPAIEALKSIAAKHAGTRAGGRAAAQLAKLQEEVAKLFAEKKGLAEELTRRCCFEEAAAALNDPLTVWKDAEIRKEAEQLVATLARRRTAIVAGYGEFLGPFDALLTEAKFDEALAAARAAAAKANDPVLRALIEGKAADAQLFARVMDRVVAGAKVEAARAALEPDRKLWLQRANGSKFKATLEKPSRAGLTVDMPGLSGEVGWGALSREQLIEFAQKAPGEATPADHVAIGLLALTDGHIKAAYEEFAAVGGDAAAQETILECLRRNASGLVYVPAGAFLAGPSKVTKQLDGFFIGRYEVSHIEYAYFLQATHGEAPPDWKNGQYPRGQDEYPVGNVTWAEANGYAQWLGLRLPTDLEWERAARGTDGRTFPWGNKFERHFANIHVPPPPGTKGPAPAPRVVHVNRGTVKGFPFPLYHIVGNVREWTSTQPPGEKSYYVVGGSAAGPERDAMTSDRSRRQAPDELDPFTGFRLVWPR